MDVPLILTDGVLLLTWTDGRLKNLDDEVSVNDTAFGTVRSQAPDPSLGRQEGGVEEGVGRDGKTHPGRQPNDRAGLGL